MIDYLKVSLLRRIHYRNLKHWTMTLFVSGTLEDNWLLELGTVDEASVLELGVVDDN